MFDCSYDLYPQDCSEQEAEGEGEERGNSNPAAGQDAASVLHLGNGTGYGAQLIFKALFNV